MTYSLFTCGKWLPPAPPDITHTTSELNATEIIIPNFCHVGGLTEFTCYVNDKQYNGKLFVIYFETMHRNDLTFL